MATALQIHSSPSSASNDWITRTASSRTEALSLFVVMRQKGETIESIRELIQVPAEIENALRRYGREYPEEAPGIDRAIMFRRTVLEEFERLVRS